MRIIKPHEARILLRKIIKWRKVVNKEIEATVQVRVNARKKLRFYGEYNIKVIEFMASLKLDRSGRIINK